MWGELSLPGTGMGHLETAPEDVPRAGRGMRQEMMWKPPVAQVCKPLVQPALVGLEQRCRASSHGDRVPVGLGRAGAPWSDEEALGEQLSPGGSSRAGYRHPALGGVTVGCSPSGTLPYTPITTQCSTQLLL